MSLAIAAAQRIFVYQSACDMRRSFDRLAAMVEHELHCDVMRGDYFLFLNRRSTMVKLLYWDGDGFAIWYKRLERGRFRMGEKAELDRAELSLLLEGVEAKELRRLPRYKKTEQDSVLRPQWLADYVRVHGHGSGPGNTAGRGAKEGRDHR